MSVNNDYSNLWGQQQLANTNSLLGGINGSSSSPTIAGIDGNLIQQKALLNANSAAYRRLLEAQKTGSIKKEKQYTELLSDRYFNDNYDAKTGTIKKPTYTPESASRPTVDSELTAGEILDDMRRLALAAINGSDKLTDTHYDLFEQMYRKIADNLITGKSKEEGPEVVVEDATPGVVTKNVDFHLLTDDQNFTVAGPKGEKNYNFATGASLNDIVAAINADTEETGVKAEWSKNSDGSFEIKFSATETGKDSFVRVDQNVGDMFAAAGSSVSGKGTDALKEKTETVATDEDTQAALAVGVFTGALFSDQTFTLSGANGSKQFSFDKGTSAEDVVAAINAASDQTGVLAEVIYNSAGEAEGIGLLADKAGNGNFIQVVQDRGDLFANQGKSVKVSGSSVKKDGDGPAITSLSDLGLVSIDGKTYSFADLAPGGSASLANNPDAALAVIDQALRDIYEGRAEIKGFDPVDTPMLNLGKTDNQASTNAREIGNYGSDAMSDWIAKYIKESSE